MSCTSASIRAEPVRPSTVDRPRGQVLLVQQTRAQGVVDVVVEVRDAVDHPHDPPLLRRGLRRAGGMVCDAVAHLLGEVEARAVALQVLDHAQRVLVVAEAPAEALAQAGVEHLLADVPERRVPEVVAEADRLVRSSLSASARATVREILVTSSVCVSRVR